MHVIATAGHVDHGKSTLVRALTGMEPDRWAEERHRGMTLDLGFCWTTLPGAVEVAFVDVPGHERFVPNMLAGVGPVPAVLFVVAADEGWMPQSEEHLAAIDAFDVRHGLLAVTRSDLSDPAPAMTAARERIFRTSLGDVPALAVSGATGAGLAELRAGLRDLVAGLPDPDPAADVRLWVDRCFTVRGSGTVVTGTLPAGTVREGDRLHVARTGRQATVRALQSLGQPVPEIRGVARVALNLRGVDRHDLGRGDAVVTPGHWHTTTLADARLVGHSADRIPNQLILHAGSAAVPVRIRRLGADMVRIQLGAELPLRIGDRALLRDPGAHRICAGLVVMDVQPPALSRRGDARRRAAALARGADGAAQVRTHGPTRAGTLYAIGVPPPPYPPLVADWYVDPDAVPGLRRQVARAVDTHRAGHPLEPGPTVESVRRALGLPDARLVEALVDAPYVIVDGRVINRGDELPPAVTRAVADLAGDLAATPFVAPEAHRLAALGLGPREIAAAARAGLLLRVAEGIVLPAGADAQAAEVLSGLPQPFTVADARRALGTTRRVAVPLLELFDHRGLTRRLPDDRREISGGEGRGGDEEQFGETPAPVVDTMWKKSPP